MFLTRAAFFFWSIMARPARFIERVIWRRILADGYKFAGFVLLLGKLIYGAAAAVHLFGYTP